MSELQVRPLPEGVDPTRLESYLTVDDFQVRQSITFVHKKKTKGKFFLDCFLLRPSVINLFENWFFLIYFSLTFILKETMGMTKPEFYALPAWRQTQLRKETGLF